MTVKNKNGKFAKKTSAIFKFCKRTGKTVEEYYKWASQCGLKGYISNKNKIVCQKYSLGNIQDLKDSMVTTINSEIKASEINDYIFENCQNAIEMSACYLEIRNSYQEYQDKNDFIQANLGKFPKESFLRWSDKNYLDQVSKKWFDTKGIPLDVQAEILTETFFCEISINDIVEFLLNNSKSKYINDKHLLITKYREKVELLCGFKCSEKYIEYLSSLLTDTPITLELISEDVPF